MCENRYAISLRGLCCLTITYEISHAVMDKVRPKQSTNSLASDTIFWAFNRGETWRWVKNKTKKTTTCSANHKKWYRIMVKRKGGSDAWQLRRLWKPVLLFSYWLYSNVRFSPSILGFCVFSLKMSSTFSVISKGFSLSPHIAFLVNSTESHPPNSFYPVEVPPRGRCY